jgi:hypothetical protein
MMIARSSIASAAHLLDLETLDRIDLAMKSVEYMKFSHFTSCLLADVSSC